jgi:flagellar basal body rod protein FlgB
MTNLQKFTNTKQEREKRWVEAIKNIPKPSKKVGNEIILTESGQHLINLSSVGNLKKNDVLHTYTLKRIYGGKGKLYPTKEGGNTSNLKKGGRTELKRHTLTSHAKNLIRDAGFVLSAKVENDVQFNSTIMITLTYGKNVPDHKTAKKHLNTFLTNCRNNNWLRYYVWVAQLQTGKRAKEKGLKSYRAENGNAIHFHILSVTERGNDLQLSNAQKVLRSYWKDIVNKWEIKQGYEAQNIGGVDVTAVYNSANYISRYISNEEETIIGNMWNISSGLRKAINETKEHIQIPECDFNTLAKNLSIKKQYRVNAEGKTEQIRQASKQTIAVKNWDESFVILSNDINSVLLELQRIQRNRNKLKYDTNEKVFELQQ